MITTPKIKKAGDQVVALEQQLLDPALAQASRAELRAMAVEQISAAHERATARVREDLQRMAVGANADLLLTESNEYGVPIGHVPVALAEQAADGRAWLTFALGVDALVERFQPLLDEMPEGVDADTRSARVADIRRRIVEAEVRENDLILAAEDEGIFVDPRPGQRPEAAILVGYGA